MKPHYYGKESKEFWRRISVLQTSSYKDWDRLYVLGVKLQNLEYQLLEELRMVEKKVAKQKKNKKR